MQKVILKRWTVETLHLPVHNSLTSEHRIQKGNQITSMLFRVKDSVVLMYQFPKCLKTRIKTVAKYLKQNLANHQVFHINLKQVLETIPDRRQEARRESSSRSMLQKRKQNQKKSPKNLRVKVQKSSASTDSNWLTVVFLNMKRMQCKRSFTTFCQMSQK